MSGNSNPSSFSCLHCTKTFALNKNLIRHCRVFHKDLAQPEHRRSGRKGESSDATLLKCSLCTKAYTQRTSLERHKKKQHFQPALQPNRHQRMEKPTFHEFKDVDEFLNWKTNLEKATMAKFVKVRKDRRIAGTIYQQFYCHRSGKPRLKSSRLRHIKVQGSCKTGSFCPAAIFTSVAESGAVKVRFYAQHMGHQQDLEHIPLMNDPAAESLTSSFLKTETTTMPDEFNVTRKSYHTYLCVIPGLNQQWIAYSEHQLQTETQSLVCNVPNSDESRYATGSTNQLQFVAKPIKSADESNTTNDKISTVDLQSTPVNTALNGNEDTEMVELTNSTSNINKIPLGDGIIDFDDSDEQSEEDGNLSTNDGERHPSIPGNIENSNRVKNTVPVHQFTPTDVAYTMMHARKCVQVCVEAVQRLTIAIQCTAAQFLSSTRKAVDKDGQLTALKAYTESIQAAVQKCQESNTEAVDIYEHAIINAAATVSDEPKETVTVTQTQAQSYEVFDTDNQATVSNKSGQPVEINATLCPTVRHVSQDHAYGISSKPTKKVKITQQFDHNGFTKDSPRYFNRKFISINDRLIENAKQRKTMLQRIRRLKRSVSSLTDTVTELRKQNLASESAAEALVLNTCSIIPQALFSRMFRDKKLGHLSREKYPEELRRFALTLHSYSPKAYQYIRESFQMCLPRTDIVKTWYQSLNGEAGLATESINLKPN